MIDAYYVMQHGERAPNSTEFTLGLFRYIIAHDHGVYTISSRECLLKPGDQITYIPNHANGDTLHRDSEDGFVTSIKTVRDGQQIVFCRYWSKTSHGELRTKANSEGCDGDNLIRRQTHSQFTVDALLKAING